jgi:undecaprenol kinase
MKQQPFSRRLHDAFLGIHHAWKAEPSFRTQVLGAVAALALLTASRAGPVWWALLALTTAGVLSFELMNTALELVMDRLHPEHDPQIGRAKDCAAGAVLVFSGASVVVAVSLIFQTWIFS